MAQTQLAKYGVKVYSPTYKRAGKIDVIKLFPDVILGCHEFEADDYRKHHDNELLILPDNLQKNMAKVRNYILDNSNTDYVLMIDDDVKSLLYIEEKQQKPIEDLETMIINGFEMSKEIGTKLWGLNLINDPEAYRIYTPFSLQSPILGPFHAVIKSDIRYDERLSLNEDYDFFIQHIFKFKKTLRFNKYSYLASHLDKKGGCGSYRLLTEEISQSKVMQNKWGRNIINYNFNKTTNPRVRI